MGATLPWAIRTLIEHVIFAYSAPGWTWTQNIDTLHVTHLVLREQNCSQRTIWIICIVNTVQNVATLWAYIQEAEEHWEGRLARNDWRPPRYMKRLPTNSMDREHWEACTGLFMVAVTRLADDGARWRTLVKATTAPMSPTWLRESEREGMPLLIRGAIQKLNFYIRGSQLFSTASHKGSKPVQRYMSEVQITIALSVSVYFKADKGPTNNGQRADSRPGIENPCST